MGLCPSGKINWAEEWAWQKHVCIPQGQWSVMNTSYLPTNISKRRKPDRSCTIAGKSNGVPFGSLKINLPFPRLTPKKHIRVFPLLLCLWLWVFMCEWARECLCMLLKGSMHWIQMLCLGSPGNAYLCWQLMSYSRPTHSWRISQSELWSWKLDISSLELWSCF